MTQAILNLSKAADLAHEVRELIRHTRDDSVSGYDRLPRDVQDCVNEAVTCLSEITVKLRCQ